VQIPSSAGSSDAQAIFGRLGKRSDLRAGHQYNVCSALTGSFQGHHYDS
jgi:hypothetical protein